MKREAGIATASVVAVAALFGASSLRGNPGAETGGRAVRTAAASTHAPRAGKPTPGPCDELQDLFTGFLALKPASPGQDARFTPAACNDDGKLEAEAKAPAGLHLRVVLATLPDPLHTNLPLGFDRYAQAIEQGALASGYNYDSSWLPWKNDPHTYALLEDQVNADALTDRREDQPGVLLFRKQVSAPSAASPANLPFQDDLVVFVVGEAATSGIHRSQFRHAVDWIALLNHLSPAGSTQIQSTQILGTQILGPSFSGSLPSLDQLLSDPAIAAVLKPANGDELQIYSGQITNKKAADWFLSARSRSDNGTLNKIRFHSFQQDIETVTKLYLGFLDANGVAGCHLAVVSEDETAYGSDNQHVDNLNKQPTNVPALQQRDCTPPPKPCPGCERADSVALPLDPAALPPDPVAPTRYFYPRDISALRAAYQQQSLFSRSGSQSGDTAQHTLRDDLSDSDAEPDLTDTIRSYGGSQTALTEEATLLQIVSMMRAHRTQFILLRSSNSLDSLFLTRFFKLTYPEGRVVIFGNDLLLRRDVAASGMNGVTTLGAWPLLPDIDHWTRKFVTHGDAHLHLSFPQGEAQGEFVALRFLLAGQPTSAAPPDCLARQNAAIFLPPNCADLDIPDYRYPFWLKQPLDRDAQVPVTWLSVLGSDGFAPVASLALPSSPDGKPDAPLPTWTSTPQRPATLSAFAAVWNAIAETLREAWCGTPDTHFRDLPLSMNVCLCLVLVWSFFHLAVYSAPSITVKPTHRTSFVRLRRLVARPLTGGIHPHTHIVLVVLGSFLVTVVATLLAWGYGWMSPLGPVIYYPRFYAFFPILIWTIGFCAVLANVWVEQRLTPRPESPLWCLALARLWSSLRARSKRFNRFHKVLRLAAARAALKLKHRPWLHQLTGLRKRSWLKLPRWWNKLFAGSPAAHGQALLQTLMALVAYTLLTFAFYAFYLLFIDNQLSPQVRTLTYLRSVNLTTGVSPVVPLVLLALGMYGWCWATLHGLCLFGDDRPVLPPDESLGIAYKPSPSARSVREAFFTMLDSSHAARPIEDLCAPFRWPTTAVVLTILLVIAAADAILSGGGVPIRSLGTDHYAWVVFGWLSLLIAVLLANAWQLTRLWLRLREMLVFLDRLPLRRTLQVMRGFSWDSIWKLGGNVLDIRYRLFYRQFETLNHLHGNLTALLEKQGNSAQPLPLPLARARQCLTAIEHSLPLRRKFARWYASHWDDWTARDLTDLKAVQGRTATLAALMLTKILVPAWNAETESLLILPPGAGSPTDLEAEHMRMLVEALPPHIRDAEEIVCLVYLGFIQNILGRMRSLVLGMIALFLSIALVVPSYPFDPRPLLTGSVVALFLVSGLAIFTVYSQIFRDATLSHLTNTRPGELGSDFWLKFLGFGIGPILGLFATIFPELSNFVSSWLQPGLSSLK